MGRPSLEGVDLKLKRAVNRFEAVVNTANDFLAQPDSHTLGIEDHPQPPGVVLRVKEVSRTPPPEIGLLIGECVQQYRSALDHLVFQLLVANTRGRIPLKLIKRSEFPIFSSGRYFRGKFNRKGEPASGSGWAKLEGIDPDAAQVIEALQPYHRKKNPRSRVLRQLQELSNVDKHRLLHTTQAAVRGAPVTIIKGGNIASVHGPGVIPGPLKPGAVIASYKVVPIDPRYAVQVEVQPEVLTDIAFGQGSAALSVRGEPAIPILYEIGAFIGSDVLLPLTEFLGLKSSFRPGRLIDSHDLSPSEREALGGLRRGAD